MAEAPTLAVPRLPLVDVDGSAASPSRPAQPGPARLAALSPALSLGGDKRPDHRHRGLLTPVVRPRNSRRAAMIPPESQL
jgi:hypothetical protein